MRSRITRAFGFVSAILIAGCHPLPPGDINAVAQLSASSRRGRVYLVRGWRDLWSEGIDTLATELREQGIDAHTYRAAQWRDVAQAINGSEVPQSEPLVLIGFSYGADDVLEISRQLHRQVDLAIVIDPVTPPSVPANVKRCVDFYETNGVWDVFPWLRGIPLQSDHPQHLLNVDMRKQRPDLVEPGTSHSTIAGNEKLHGEIVHLVTDVCAARKS